MPSLRDRLVINNEDFVSRTKVAPSQALYGAGEPPSYSMSPSGNSAPNRSLPPQEFTYDFTADRMYPPSFTFRRRWVDVNTQIKNTALQALALALGGSVTS